jgi:hypothetical protein
VCSTSQSAGRAHRTSVTLRHQRAGEVARSAELIEMRVVVEKTAGVDKTLRSFFIWCCHFVIEITRRAGGHVFGAVANRSVQHHEPTLFCLRSGFDCDDTLVLTRLDEFGNMASRTTKDVHKVRAKAGLNEADHHHVRESPRQHTMKGVRTG